MRIIKHGVDKNNEHECECQECECTVALTPGDCGRVFDARDGNAITWKCPDCGHLNYVADSVLPASFVKAAKK